MSNTQQNERLSTFVDGELTHSSEQAELSAQLLKDRKFRQKMVRYQKIGEVMRQQVGTAVDASLVVERIQDELDNEPHLLLPQKNVSNKLQQISQIAWGAGLAAAVALVAIVVAPQFLNPTISPSSESSFVQAPSSVPLSVMQENILPVASQTGSLRANRATTENQQWKLLSPDQLQQLDRYMMEHHEFSDVARMGRPSSHINFVSVKNADQ